MKTLGFLLSLLVSISAFAQIQIVEEAALNFPLSMAKLKANKAQMALSWKNPGEIKPTGYQELDSRSFLSLDASVNTQILGKIAFISKRKFENLTIDQMNESNFIRDMLGAVSAYSHGQSWNLKNKVKAYGISFPLTYSIFLSETGLEKQGLNMSKMAKADMALAGAGEVRYAFLEMYDFSMLINGNSSLIVFKKLSENETLVISYLLCSFSRRTADRFFNYPPFSYTQEALMKNLREQTTHMIYGLRD